MLVGSSCLLLMVVVSRGLSFVDVYVDSCYSCAVRCALSVVVIMARC